MRIVEITRPGGPEVLAVRQAPVPVCGAGEVLIDVVAAGVNRPDIAQRMGRYPVPADASPIPGLEVAGTVRETGPDVQGLQPGAPVMALVHGGGYAEVCKADARHLLPVPHGLSFEQAACLPEAALTVEFNMVMRARLQAGETVLIHGGSSGIGSHAAARAKAMGAMVITTSRGAVKRDFCAGAGADIAIDSSQEDWQAAVREATGGRGADVVLDMVGGGHFDKNLASLAEDGRYALISLQAGRIVTADLEPLLRRRLTVTGSTLRPLSGERKAEIVTHVRQAVLPLVVSGAIRPHIHRRFDLEDAASAHRLLESGDVLGKVVLTVRQS
ncbi:MAG: NAD(P)H-quinone oxidoreductase [Pannonibacter phragmitetus]